LKRVKDTNQSHVRDKLAANIKARLKAEGRLVIEEIDA
jgi:hypothetical protein